MTDVPQTMHIAGNARSRLHWYDQLQWLATCRTSLIGHVRMPLQRRIRARMYRVPACCTPLSSDSSSTFAFAAGFGAGFVACLAGAGFAGAARVGDVDGVRLRERGGDADAPLPLALEALWL